MSSPQPNRYVERVRDATRSLLEDLLESNRRLCLAIAVLSERPLDARYDLDDMSRRTRGWQAERERLLELLEAADRESKAFEEQVTQVQRQNSNLAALYAAVTALHSSLETEAVLTSIQEVVVNLIGSEQFAIVRCDDNLTPWLLFGVTAAQLWGLSPNVGIIRRAMHEGRPMVCPSGMPMDIQGVRVCIPMVTQERTLGFVLIFGFLPQKTEIISLDHELFALVGNQAAAALLAAEIAAVHPRLSAET